jgi:hypothetical protein
MRMLQVACMVAILVAGQAAVAMAQSLEEFRAMPDNRLSVRTSFGVRSARPLAADQVELVIGMSVTDACQNPAAYRIVSFDDDAYAYEKFVAPTEAKSGRELEVQGVEGCRFEKFERTIVTLKLPSPMREGATYHVVAQGVGGTMVTGAHSAQSFLYKPGAPSAAAEEAVNLAVLGLRRVESVGEGILRLEFGPDFSPEAGSKLENYRVTVGGAEVRPRSFGRITRIDTYVPVGWPFAGIPMHEVFLQLPQRLQNGAAVAVTAGRTVTTAANTASMAYHDLKAVSGSIKVNQVGYIADSPVKAAYLGRWMGSFPEREAREAAGAGDAETAFFEAVAGKKEAASAAPPSAAGPALRFGEEPPFAICEEATGRKVLEGKCKQVHTSGTMDEGIYKCDHSGENVYTIDFGRLQAPGRYFVSVPGVGRSLAFDVAPDVYNQAFQVQACGVFAQRCGIELKPPWSPWHRIACHTKGVVPTTQLRLDKHDIVELAKKVDYERSKDAGLPEAMLKLNADPDLVARWPLNGNFKDVVGGHDLKPLQPKQEFTADAALLPGAYKVWGPSNDAEPAGAAAEGVSVNTEGGCTVCGFFRYKDGDKFDGTLLGLGKSPENLPLHVAVSWGVLRPMWQQGEAAKCGRLGGGEWRHFALVVSPAQPGRSQTLAAFVDGALTGSVGFSGKAEAGRFCLGTIRGDALAGKCYCDWRLYKRALTAAELETLSRHWRTALAAMPIRGGHHDAGDYNPRSHYEVAQVLMDAYEIAPQKFFDGQLSIPENRNGIPDILDEAGWAMLLWMGLQDKDGGVFDGTESDGDPNFIQTVELDPRGDFAYAKDACGSLTFAGFMAQASRIWKSLGRDKEAGDWLDRARRAYEWAMKNPPRPGRDASLYGQAWLNPKAYAAAELLHTTGEKRFNDDFLAACVWAKNPAADLSVYGLYDQSRAAWAYATCPAGVADARIQTAAREAIQREADLFIQHSSTMAYPFIRHPWAPISWGTGAYENSLTSTLWAWKLTGQEKYREWMIRTCDNTLGANPPGLCYITGLGSRTIHAPLHNSRYSHFGEVAAGQQVQGPNQRGEGYGVAETAFPRLRENFASLYTFVDSHFAISMDEGTVVTQARSMAAFGLLLPDRK